MSHNANVDECDYSDKFQDDQYEYRQVRIPEHLRLQVLRVPRLLSEDEWRNKLQIQQTIGWQHYGFYTPEPRVLLFRRPLDTPARTPVILKLQIGTWTIVQ